MIASLRNGQALALIIPRPFELENARNYFDLESEVSGAAPSFCDADFGEVNACDVPATLGKEDGIAALAHADVESPTGAKLLDNFDEKRVGSGGINRVATSIYFVRYCVPNP